MFLKILYFAFIFDRFLFEHKIPHRQLVSLAIFSKVYTEVSFHFKNVLLFYNFLCSWWEVTHHCSPVYSVSFYSGRFQDLLFNCWFLAVFLWSAEGWPSLYLCYLRFAGFLSWVFVFHLTWKTVSHYFFKHFSSHILFLLSETTIIGVLNLILISQ